MTKKDELRWGVASIILALAFPILGTIWYRYPYVPLLEPCAFLSSLTASILGWRTWAGKLGATLLAASYVIVVIIAFMHGMRDFI